MDNLINLYPGIVSVEYFDSDLLSEERPDLSAIAGAEIKIPEKRINIPLIEPGTCQVVSKDGAESLSLKFSAQTKINPPFRPAFVVRDSNNRTFLIASKSKPFPKVTINRTFGSLPESRPEMSYEIAHTALYALIQII